MAERSLLDVRQHQDIVFPWRIHADSRRAVEILDSLGMTIRKDGYPHVLQASPLLYGGEAATTTLNPEPAPLSSKLSLFVPCILLSRLL